MSEIQPVKPQALFRRCDAEQFAFATTADLDDLGEMLGQVRALEAVRFGVAIRREGYNLFVLGPPGHGKQTLVRNFLAQQAGAEPAPWDWCYVHNFEVPHRPRILRLAAGRGTQLRREMEQLVEELSGVIPATFESEEYRARVQEIEEAFKERQEEAFKALQAQAEREDIALIRTPGGFAFAPTRNGEVIAPDEFSKLPKEQRERVEQSVAELQERLKKVLQQIPRWAKETREQVKQVNREVTMYAVGHLIEELKKGYPDYPQVLAYLGEVQQDVVEHADEFRKQEEVPALLQSLQGLQGGGTPSVRRYQVNLLVYHHDGGGAPVIYEDHPTHANLVGRVEHLSQMGALVTDFTLIKAGALHRANGGYLILDAYKVLAQPYAWEGLKRALRLGEVRIESLGQMLSLVSTVSLEPEPVPLEVKVVLVGERLLYYLLYAYDPDFGELFKVAADFEEHVLRDADNDQLYARLVATLVRKDGLRPFDRHAVARVVEHASRLVEDAERLSTHVQGIADVLREADFWAGRAGREVAGAADVQQAIDTQAYRVDRLRTRVQEEISRGTILIDTAGAVVGQVNGLSVLQLGSFAFGQPARITATVHAGEGEVIDIEREVELGGAIHSKGVLILSSFLAARYAERKPLSLSASLVFEQSYGGVEGDSASLAELCALLSVLADLPIRQSLALTGSVNQLGQAQAIGGVNEKVEGFFDVCRARGLTGDQGVLIPASNLKHLMLRADVVEAAAQGRFHVYAVGNVDQAIELLTGLPAGARDPRGAYPEGSVNRRVEKRLARLAAARAAVPSERRRGRKHEAH